MNKAISAALAALVFSVGSASAAVGGSVGGATTPTPAAIPTQGACVQGYVARDHLSYTPWRYYKNANNYRTFTATAGTHLSDIKDLFQVEIIDYDTFKSRMKSVLTSPGFINCPRKYLTEISKNPLFPVYPDNSLPIGIDSKYGGPFTFDDVTLPDGTIVKELRQNLQNMELAAKWIMANGYEPKLRGTVSHNNRSREMTAAEYWKAKAIENKDNDDWSDEMYETALALAEIYKHDPLPATKPCSKVDGQTPPANERCIVAANVQESFKSRVIVPVFDGYQHITTMKLSGVGFFDDWQSTITFDCRAADGEECTGLDIDTTPPEGGARGLGSVEPTMYESYELFIRCGDGINLLDVDSIDGGEVVSISTDKAAAYPESVNCTANSSQPFTLSVQTTRLAK
ncbi:MAG: hypothetical protein ISN28_08895 [Ectothiorhodospiraceae bacterium AqS1]|nr:hypothetical protein [Ectothiorhodospiraceae bacterium AqS1]